MLDPNNLDALLQDATREFPTQPTAQGQWDRLAFLREQRIPVDYLAGIRSFDDPESLKGNIENYIGMAQVPLGLAGPMHVRGSEAQGDFYVPLATTEGALVASYSRGMKATRQAGGISTALLGEGVQRSPYFKFDTLATVGRFVGWVLGQEAQLKALVSKVGRYAELRSLQTHTEGNSVILTFVYHTGDAAGQNMVTLCTHALCQYILQQFDATPQEWYIESNYSGDKKATAVNFSTLRGKKVSAEVVLPAEVVKHILKSTPQKMAKYWQSSTLAVAQSGAIGTQGHVANALTALFIATGQDVACVAESAVGVTRMQVTDQGHLYASLTLPCLTVGTVGGGTGLPTQQECLQMLGCAGVGKARKFAEICTATALAGELSIAAALTEDHFAQAHQSLGRKQK